MELESLVQQNTGGGIFEGLEDSTYPCSFGTRFLPEKFQDIDFTLNYKAQNSKLYPDVSVKRKYPFVPSLPRSGQEEREMESMLEAKAKMTSNFPGTDDVFGWPTDFKIRKCNGGERSPNQIRSDEGSFELGDSLDASAGIKQKFWELNDLNRKLESQECEKERKKPKTENQEEGRRPNSVKPREAAGSKMPPWHVDVIDDMAADLDGSLSNLGAELAAGSYNMSEALLSLPPLTVFKQEVPSPSQVNVINPSGLQQNLEEAQDQNSTLHRLLQQSSFHNHLKRSNSSSKSAEISEKKSEDCRFQYVLAAATSIATKVTEETLTYLNQGQSYEIKLKKVGELSNFRGKILKSIIRICFHERRLQYMEKEQILAWQASRPGERIIELDVPLSYGLFDVEQDPNMLNMVSFLWDPTKEVGAYIKVNCISTEFTPKKHGGEKGVPFRIQVETFIEGETTRLHAAACQIKVFKLKGADRKHKQDREKILKRPLSEQDKYQPSYECTVLSDLPPEAVFPVPGPSNSPTRTAPLRANSVYPSVEPSDACLIPHGHLRTPVSSPGKIENTVLPDAGSEKRSPAPLPSDGAPSAIVQLSPESNSQQTAQWLRKNSFGNYVSTFANFSGADILRLTRDDLIQICGLADGIRLLYALHSKAIVRLTLYVCTPSSAVYHAVYLDHMGRNEMSRKLAKLLGIQQSQIQDIFLQGPNDIRVLVTDEVITNMKDESMFSIEVLKDESRGRFVLLLKPAQST